MRLARAVPLPVPVPLPGRRRRRRVGWTELLGVAGVGGTLTAIALEYAYVWRHGRAPLPVEGVDVLAASAEAALETVEVAVEGYRGGSNRENALLNLLMAYSTTFAGVRLSTHLVRAYGTLGPFRNVQVGRRHIHHFVPGIVVVLASGATSILHRDERLDRWLALPFGAGAALILDETALLLELDDVYWTEEGIVSVQVTLGAMALLATAAVGGRMLRRGEQRVLQAEEGGDAVGESPVTAAAAGVAAAPPPAARDVDAEPDGAGGSGA